MASKKKILFIAWDSPQVTYLEGLFIPILAALTAFEVHIMQFTWADKTKTEKLARLCLQHQITYTTVKIYRKPVSIIGVVYTLIKGISVIKKYIGKNDIDILMPRSTMPALMALKVVNSFPSIKLVFDADGLPLEERRDFAGLKKESFQYRYLKGIESKILKRADRVLTRTEKSITFLTNSNNIPADKFFTVVNGRDSNVFKPFDNRAYIRQQLGITGDAVVLVYAGSLGPQYCFTEMIEIFRHVHARENNSYLLLLTQSVEYLEHYAVMKDIENNVIRRSVDFKDMPAFLAAADIGLALRKNYFSMQGVSPIKIGEYLLCGLPVIATSSTGDMGQLLKNNTSCFLINDEGLESIEKAAEWVIDVCKNRDIKLAARETGISFFSLKSAVDSYNKALNFAL